MTKQLTPATKRKLIDAAVERLQPILSEYPESDAGAVLDAFMAGVQYMHEWISGEVEL